MIKRTPIRIQVNPIECASVVLNIILNYYKHNITTYELNNLVGVSRFGTNAKALMRAAESLGFKAYAQKIILSDLKKTKAPSILFVDNSHFVVFEGYFLGRYYINDPALGRYKLSALELRKRLSGVQIILEPTKKLLKNTRDYSSINFMGSQAIFLGLLTGLSLLLLISILALNMQESVKYLNLISLFLIILIFFYTLFIKISDLKLTNSYAQATSSWLLERISQSSPNFFTTRPFSSFTQILKHMSRLNNIKLSSAFLSRVLMGIIIIIILGIALIYWPFAVIASALFVLALVLDFRKSLNIDLGQPIFYQAFEHYLDLAAMGQNRELIKQQITLFTKNQAQQKFSYQLFFNFLPIWLSFPIIFYWGSLNISQGNLTTLEIYIIIILIIFLIYLTYLLASNLSRPRQEQDRAFLREISDLAKLTPNKAQNIYSNNLLEVSNAYFIYPGESSEIFKNFNLILERSKIYAIKANPTAGVTTLLKLLGQKLVWTSGMQKLERADLRVALIDDEADLFEGSLLENIRLFDRNISEAQVVEALAQACVLELFYQRPMGLLAMIYEGGANVSGGQKKRLLLARALVHKPDLIILDDFFETLECERALKIIKNLRELKHSVIFSSLRSEEQELADKIISWSTQA